MPAVSKSQQRFFGMVHACQKQGKCASSKISKTAHSISKKDAKDFAKTSHAGLPEKVEHLAFKDWLYELELANAEICKSQGKPAGTSALGLGTCGDHKPLPPT
jgi:hypothetical protein